MSIRCLLSLCCLLAAFVSVTDARDFDLEAYRIPRRIVSAMLAHNELRRELAEARRQLAERQNRSRERKVERLAEDLMEMREELREEIEEEVEDLQDGARRLEGADLVRLQAVIGFWQAARDALAGNADAASPLALLDKPAPAVSLEALGRPQPWREGSRRIVIFWDAARDDAGAFLAQLDELSHRAEDEHRQLLAPELRHDRERVAQAVKQAALHQYASYTVTHADSGQQVTRSNLEQRQESLGRWVGLAAGGTIERWHVCLPVTAVIDEQGHLFQVYLGQSLGLIDSLKADLQTLDDIRE